MSDGGSTRPSLLPFLKYYPPGRRFQIDQCLNEYAHTDDQIEQPIDDPTSAAMKDRRAEARIESTTLTDITK